MNPTRILVDQGTFAVVGPDGDVNGTGGSAPDGLFVRDARHLSRWRLTANGRPLAVLTADDRTVVLVPPGTRDEPAAYTVLRDQTVTAGSLVERLTLLNNLPQPVRAVVELTVDADFADQFELRSDRRAYAKTGAVRGVEPRPEGVTFTYRRGPGWSASTAVTADPAPQDVRPAEDAAPEVQPPADAPGNRPRNGPASRLPHGPRAGAPSTTATVLTWRLTLPPHGTRDLSLAAQGFPAGGPAPAEAACDGGIPAPEKVRARRARDLAAFTDAEPRPEQLTDWQDLARTARQGLSDLAGLHLPVRGIDGEPLAVPGAGTPWFLTLFGRDSLLTSLFCLPYRPAMAAATLSALAAAQGTVHDTRRLEQPGRIPHELRHGELAHFGQVPYGRYYGSVDATPLFLVLLQSHAEATGDTTLARRLEGHARAAVEWMFRDGGLGAGGWLVYTADDQAGGLANQNWKDSAGAVCFADGTQATGAIAVAEVQGYAYDALRRTAWLASVVWHDEPFARRLQAVAADLQLRFPQEFWLAGQDFPALALDGQRRQVDALASDAGHLLWSGILDQSRAARVAARLLQDDFFSGWGVRTLASGQDPYHPLSYHRGGIWPHDNAVIALGMARHGLAAEARTLASALLEAARHTGWRLPEVMSGYGRDLHAQPVPYPHACSPQAWAAATPLALLTAVGHRPALRGPIGCPS